MLLLVLATSAALASGNRRNDAPQACGPKFSLVPSDSIRPSAESRLNAVATNGDQVVAVGFYRKPLSDRKSGLIEIWDGTRMRAIPTDLGGFENEFNWITSDPNGGFKFVGTVWEMTVKGLRSKIVVGRFDGGRFIHEATIAIPGSVRNIPHRILVSGSTTWVSGYFTRKFGNPPTALKPEFVQMDRPYPAMRGGGKRPLVYVKPGQPRAYPAYTKWDAETYPLLASVEGSAWKWVRFPGEGWLDGMASREAGHLVIVGMSNGVASIFELQGTNWGSLDIPEWLKVKEERRLREFSALLDVIATPKGLILSDLQVSFGPSGIHYAPGTYGGIDEMTADGRFWELGSMEMGADPQAKVLVPAIPGHNGVRYYGVSRPYSSFGEGRVERVLLYPGFRNSDYLFRFKGEGVATTRTSVWAVGSLNEAEVGGSWQVAVLRACPPLQVAASSPAAS